MMNVGSVSRVIGVVAALWVSACDKSGGGATDLSATGKARLADYCAKRDTCQAELGVSVEPCPTSMCLASNVNEPAVLQFFDCQLAKPCPMFFNDDDCVAAAGTPDAVHDAFVTRCNAKADMCGASFREACPVIGMPIIKTEWVLMFDACLDRPCAEVEACWDAADELSCW